MSDLLYSWQFTITAGTTTSSPASLSMLIPATTVERFTVRVPPGPRGTVGWQLWYGGGLMFPFAAGTWIVADDTEVEFVPSTSYNGGAWSMHGYNSGVYDHTLYIEARVAALSATLQTVPESAPVAIT